MPRVRVPVKRGKEQKIPCPGYLENKFHEMVAKTAHLPDDNLKKFSNKTVRDHNRAIRRLKNDGQVSITQLLQETTKSSGSDSDFVPKAIKKRAKKGEEVKISKATVVKKGPRKSLPVAHNDSASSIDSVYVTGVKSPPKATKSVKKQVETPSSDGFLSSDEESCGVFRRTRKKPPPTTKYQELLTPVQRNDEVATGIDEEPFVNPNTKTHEATGTGNPKPPKLQNDWPYPGINPIRMPFSETQPQPGDLVMSTAGEILHPAVYNQSVDASYILLGVVTAYTYVKWVSEEGQDQFDNYANNHERVVVTWQVIDSLLTAQRFIDANYWPCNLPRENNTTYDVIVDIPPTHVDKLKILCKKNSCKLSGLNEFLCEQIVIRFTYDMNLGWQHKK